NGLLGGWLEFLPALQGFSFFEFFFAFVELCFAVVDLSLSPLAELLAAGAPGGREFGFGGDGAEVGVEDDLVDGLGRDAGGVGLFLGYVEAGDLETVEEQASAAEVEFA